MQYFNQDFFKMSIGFLLIVGLGLLGVYWSSRSAETAPPASELTGEVE